MKKQNLLLPLVAMLASTVTIQAMHARSAAGIIAGEVTDPSGSVVAGAKVTISAGNWTETVLTNESGQYTISNLTPGKYEVAVNSDGFSTFDRAGLSVVANRQTKMDAPLELAPMHEIVNVSAQ